MAEFSLRLAFTVSGNITVVPLEKKDKGPSEQTEPFETNGSQSTSRKKSLLLTELISRIFYKVNP